MKTIIKQQSQYNWETRTFQEKNNHKSSTISKCWLSNQDYEVVRFWREEKRKICRIELWVDIEGKATCEFGNCDCVLCRNVYFLHREQWEFTSSMELIRWTVNLPQPPLTIQANAVIYWAIQYKQILKMELLLQSEALWMCSQSKSMEEEKARNIHGIEVRSQREHNIEIQCLWEFVFYFLVVMTPEN